MPVQVTHNNDGHFYTIDVDIAKEGAEVFDLSTYFKARVGDNHVGLRVRWFWQGQVFNTVGKKPRVEGAVGQYSFKEGKNGTRDLVMSPDASGVSFNGDIKDCEPGGYATYYFPGQMFPQEGLFKGTIGLVDDSGETAHYTSVDIWFKVYPQAGGAQMGRACDFYISELDKAIKEAEDDLAAAKKSMQQVVDDFTAKMNDLSNQITTQATTDKAALAALETKIAQDDLFTKKEADAFKQAIVDQLVKIFKQAKDAVADAHVATNMANFALAQGDNYTLSLPGYMQDSFNHATKDVPHGDNIVNVAFITDNHWQEDGNDIFDNSDGYAYHSLQHYQWFAEGTLVTKPDVVIADGDNVNGDDNRTSNIYTTRHVKAMLDSSYVKSSIFMLPGNHDLGINQFSGSKKPGVVMSNDDLKSVYDTKPCRFGEIRNDDSLYFYKDLEDKKVRIIGLNSSDGPMTTDSNGEYIWDALNVHVFSAEQLSWLVNKALVLPDNSWQVAIFFHAPIGKAFGGWDKDATSTINSDCLLDILNAFKNGTTTSCNSSNSLAPISGLTADFTSQGKGTIIGIFNGHFHKDMQDLSTLNGTPMVETDASLTSQLNSDRYNTVNEDCWETISIDTSKRTFHCYRFGRGQDREFNY